MAHSLFPLTSFFFSAFTPPANYSRKIHLLFLIKPSSLIPARQRLKRLVPLLGLLQPKCHKLTCTESEIPAGELGFQGEHTWSHLPKCTANTRSEYNPQGAQYRSASLQGSIYLLGIVAASFCTHQLRQLVLHKPQFCASSRFTICK